MTAQEEQIEFNYVNSIKMAKDGQKGEIANKSVVDDIRKEIERLEQLYI